MAEKEFLELSCIRCGGQLKLISENTYQCSACGKTFEKQVVTDVVDQLRAVLNEQKQEAVANLRRQLWAEMHEENTNSEKVRSLARDLKKYLPEDYFANFCEIANSEVENNSKQINAFLNKTSQADIEDYADIILDFMIRSLRTEYITALAQVIERAYKGKDSNSYNKYTTWLESEADKLDKGIYDLTLPRDVFLAYSSADMDKVLEICEYLESNNITCFLALRNLRHGRNAIHDYDGALKKAIDHCKTLVFVSSTNSRNRECDAFTKELEYIRQKELLAAPPQLRYDYSKLPAEYMMPRVEYVIEDYNGNVAEKTTYEFFHGLEWAKSKEAVAERVLNYLIHTPVVPVEPIQTPRADAAKRLKRVLRLIEAGDFEDAETRLDNIERDEEAAAGECEIVEVYHYKILIEYAVKNDDDLVNKLIEKQVDITKNKNYILAMDLAEEKEDEAELLALISIKVKVKNGIAEAAAAAAAAAEAARVAREQAEAERKRREEEERKRKAEEERKRREAEAAAEAERKRREEEERKRREAEAAAEAERKRREEEERKRKAAEEAKKSILNIGNYRDIGGGYIAFGAYPQSKKASNVQIGEQFDTERGYYLGSDNNLYAKENGEYYKVEPIKWKVLKSGSELFIVSDLILDQHCFDGSSNNYANSEIRSWLNDEFYKKVFTESQRNLILTTNVDNSVSSTGYSTNQYVCDNTNDKIFLLSHKEAEQYYRSSSARQKKGTDYAKARGLWVNSDNGNSFWWLRSPCFDLSIFAQNVDIDGDFNWDYVSLANYGVLPALKFKP